MAVLSANGMAIAEARQEVIRTLAQPQFIQSPPSPISLVKMLAAGKNSEPYRVAVTALLASGEIVATPTWKLRLPVT